MHAYEVGELYNPQRTSWPQTPMYNFRNGQHELLIFLKAPTDEEILSVREGEARFAFAVEGEVIFFLHRFAPSVPWSDCPFTIHLISEHERALPKLDTAPNERALLSVTLIDADTGIIKAIRAVTFGHFFTRALHKAISDQAAQPFDGARYGREVDSTLARFQTKDLLKRAVATTSGGE